MEGLIEDASTTTLTRGYVPVAGRHVHLRSGGAGPALVLMHDSPRSSRRMIPLARALARRFHVIAVDTPGFGGSDPLQVAAPRVEDLADSLCATLDALRIERPVVYGTHTSSKIAVELALRHRGRVAALLLDGISMQPEPVRRQFLEGEYLKGYPATLDGAHLASIWAKMRDQFRFFPYNDRSLNARLRWPMPDAAEIEEHLLDMLQAGPEFGRTYGAAFRYDPAPRLPQLDVPTTIVCRADDVLAGELARLPSLPACISVEPLPAEPQVWRDAIFERLERHRDCASAGPDATAATVESSPTRRFIGPAAAQVHMHLLGRRSRDPVLVLPDLPGGAETMLDIATTLATRYRVIVPDLPGCGDSDPVAGEVSIDAVVSRLWPALLAVESRPLRLLAPAWSTPIALSLANRAPAQVKRLVLDGLLVLDPRQREQVAQAWPDLRPEPAGSHLLRAWHFLRDQSLAWPWCESDPAGIRSIAPDLDAGRLQASLLALLKQRQSAIALFQACAQSDTLALLLAGSRPVTVLDVEGDPGYRIATCPPEVIARVRRRVRPAGRAAASGVISQCLARGELE